MCLLSQSSLDFGLILGLKSSLIPADTNQSMTNETFLRVQIDQELKYSGRNRLNSVATIDLNNWQALSRT
jgi:hypothetical protein